MNFFYSLSFSGLEGKQGTVGTHGAGWPQA